MTISPHARGWALMILGSSGHPAKEGIYPTREEAEREGHRYMDWVAAFAAADRDEERLRVEFAL